MRTAPAEVTQPVMTGSELAKPEPVAMNSIANTKAAAINTLRFIRLFPPSPEPQLRTQHS